MLFRSENAGWSYEQPFPAMAGIENRLAFYIDKVEVYALNADGENANPQPVADEHLAITVDDVVQHTDSGSGTSQREHWPANASAPEKAG